MARRRKTQRTRRRTPRISITGTAQSLIVANAMVKGASNANLFEFFTGKVDTGSNLGAYYNPTNKDDVITLPEILGIDRKAGYTTLNTGGQYYLAGQTASPALQLEKMKDNVMDNWASMLGTAIVVPVAFKFGKKVMTKAGVARGVNKVLDVAGVKEVRF